MDKMSKLEELIQKYCPDGVKYIALGEFCDIKTGKGVTKKDNVANGLYPVISGGLEPMGFVNERNRCADTVTIARAGSAGFVNYLDKDFYLNDKCFSVIPFRNYKDTVINKFLYYVLKNIEEDIVAMKSTGSVPTVNTEKVSKVQVPLPALPVQREIVRILDEFSLLSAELSAELAARKQQYEHYKNELLDFADSEMISLSDLFNLRNGFTPSKGNPDYWTNGTLPWFRMEDIRENGRILSDAIQHITMEAAKNKPFPANSIIVSTSATIGEHALITTDFLSNQRFTCLSLKDEYKDQFDMKFLFYYCFKLDEYCSNNLNQGNFASVDMTQFGKFRFPVVPINEQKRIVTLLEKFDYLANDINQGLPAEIKARQKQYEYYRDKLLSFKRLNV